MQYLMQSQKQQNDLCSFPRQTIQFHSNPNLCLTSIAEEAERFYEDLQDLLELTPRKVLFIILNSFLEVAVTSPLTTS